MSRNYKKSEDVPNHVLAERLAELAGVITRPGPLDVHEFKMRIPAEVDHDADLVMAEAARRLKKLETTN